MPLRSPAHHRQECLCHQKTRVRRSGPCTANPRRRCKLPAVRGSNCALMWMTSTAMAAGTEGLALTHAGDIGGSDLPTRFAAGEAGAFEQVVALYQPRVARLAHRLLGWQGDVDDVVQDVFLAAFTNARSFRGGSSLWTWLTAITLHSCRRHARRAALTRRVREWLGRQPSHWQTAAAGAEQMALEDEAGARVRDAVAGLP